VPVVLIVDDEPILAIAIVQHLARMLPDGWRAAAETSGDRALRTILADADHEIRVCIVDMQLERQSISGRELVERILSGGRSDLRRRIIVSSGEMIPPTDPLLTDLECVALGKPFELEDLDELARELINRAAL
jgi:CheY-like chemotaxis protein